MAEIERLEVGAYTIPTDQPESDGTLQWDSTTIVIVEVSAAGTTGIGWTYGHEAVAKVICLRDTEVGREGELELADDHRAHLPEQLAAGRA